MNNIHILALAESLDYGESLREECPTCNGKDRTLSITRTDDGAVLYQCFRASCDTKGVIGGSKSMVKRLEVQVPKRKVWEGQTTDLPEPVTQWVQDTWGISDPPHWYYTEDHGGRIAMSIRSPKDTHRGWVLRNDGSQMPKALTYLDEGELALSWYLLPGILDRLATGTILVEDIPSAIRASRYVNACALIGTACGEDKALEIREHKRGTVWIALDDDATDQALKLQKMYSLLWDEPRVLPLKQDLKDMNEADLCEIMTRISSTT
jgi:hypothetical protein